MQASWKGIDRTTPTPTSLRRFESFVGSVTSERVVAYSDDGKPITAPLIPWPALHESLKRSLREAQARAK